MTRRRRRGSEEATRERWREGVFTEEIGVLEALGGDEEDLQLPVHHVCRCSYSPIAGRLQFLGALQLQRGREIQRGQSETTALSPWRPNQEQV